MTGSDDPIGAFFLIALALYKKQRSCSFKRVRNKELLYVTGVITYPGLMLKAGTCVALDLPEEWDV